MDLIYNCSQESENKILIQYSGLPDSIYFLVSIKNPCYDVSGVFKNAILTPDGCDGGYILNFHAVTESNEDLINGLINFKFIGTYKTDIYYQDNNTNTDPDNATYLSTIKLQVNYN